MGYDSIKKRASEYSEKKTGVDTEDSILRQDELELDSIFKGSLTLDSDLQENLNSIRREYDSERIRIDNAKSDLEFEKKEISDDILSEMGKLSEAEGKLSRVKELKYGKEADTALKKCKEHLNELTELLDQLGGEEKSENTNMADTKGIEQPPEDKSFFSELFGIDDTENSTNLNITTPLLKKSFVEGMSKTLASCGHDNIKKVYASYADKLTVADSNYTEGAFYRHGEGVYMNEKQVAKGSLIHKPYQTAFHEFGHNIDYLMGNGFPISESWNDGQLYSAIQSDFNAIKGDMTNEELITKLRQDMYDNNWSIMEMASVSDILECMTGISYPFGVGHGADYWVEPIRLPCKEFFAEVLDGKAANEESYSMMKRFFPSAVNVVNDILDNIN